MVGERTFGGHRYLNQVLYHSQEWRSFKRRIILRDNGCDLGDESYPIYGSIYIHHINPISINDILGKRKCVFDPDNVICTSFKTHEAIHYGKDVIIQTVTRKKHDTSPWR